MEKSVIVSLCLLGFVILDVSPRDISNEGTHYSKINIFKLLLC